MRAEALSEVLKELDLVGKETGQCQSVNRSLGVGMSKADR